MADGPPNAKRQKLDPFPGSDSSAYNNYGLGSTQGLSSTMGGGVVSNPSQQQWNLCHQQNVLSNMDMFDLENDLPDELMSSTSWGLSDNMGNSKPPPHGPGPGQMQNGIESAADSGNTLRQMQHNMLQNKGGLISNALAMAGGQLGNKSPNLQSPPNVSVAKGNVVDQMNLGSLPSSISNNAGLQSIANNGTSPQIMSSIQGMNNSAGGNMIMTNSSMSTIAGMAGGGLVVSSTVNKPLTNTTNMMAPGQPHHPGNHTVPQQPIQNGPMISRVPMQHLNARVPGPHGVHMGTRMQAPGMMPLGGVAGQGMPNKFLIISNEFFLQFSTGVATPQPHANKLGLPQTRFGGPAGPVGPAGGGEGGMAPTQLPAPSPAQPQSGAPSGSQPGPQTATQNPGTGPPPSSLLYHCISGDGRMLTSADTLEESSPLLPIHTDSNLVQVRL